ncbi:MAG: hypothetical protein NTZ65_00215 [Candidatus Berkelbacteria bacterium]|nr:hypothetical protein [Candidatus Berkelbacteria bacterium]
MREKEVRHVSAEIISWLFYPPLVGTVFFVFLVFWYSTDLNQGLHWLVAISPFLIFIPLIYFVISFKLGWISDIDLTDRKERPIFLSAFIVSLALASALLYLLSVPTKFFVYVFSGLVMTVVTSIITLFWKISFHTAVTTSVVTAITILGGPQFWPLFLLIPIIGWARVMLKKHTFWQVVGGALVAFVITEGVFLAFGFNVLF